MQSLLAQTANPEPPYEVNVGQPSDALTARAAAAGAFDSLFLGLGVVALIVGAVGVANLLEPSFAHSRPTEPKVRDSNPLERATCLAALSLQSSDVPCVHVRRAIVNGQLTAPKSRHGRRTIPISLELVDRLRELVAGCGETEPLLLGAQGAALRAGICVTACSSRPRIAPAFRGRAFMTTARGGATEANNGPSHSAARTGPWQA